MIAIETALEPLFSTAEVPGLGVGIDAGVEVRLALRQGLEDTGKCVHAACGDTPGFVVVPTLDYGAENNFGGISVRPDGEGAQGLKVRATPVDSLGLRACHVIKIDVEGFEARVLRGAAETIRKCRPILYVENDRQAHQQEIISLMADMGYRLYWHLPPLFSADNFNGCAEDVFGRIVSVNILAFPQESDGTVHGEQPIDPANWASPVKLSL